MREPLHDDVDPRKPSRSDRHRRRHRRSRLVDLLVTALVAIMVAGAFVVGTRMQAKPIAPTSAEVVQTQCTINTESVRVAVEGLREAVNNRRKGKLTEAKFDSQVADAIPDIADAVRSQTVSCKQAPAP
jgi:hypothetical protein